MFVLTVKEGREPVLLGRVERLVIWPPDLPHCFLRPQWTEGAAVPCSE